MLSIAEITCEITCVSSFEPSNAREQIINQPQYPSPNLGMGWDVQMISNGE